MNMTDLSQLMWGLKVPPGIRLLSESAASYTEVVMLFTRSGQSPWDRPVLRLGIWSIALPTLLFTTLPHPVWVSCPRTLLLCVCHLSPVTWEMPLRLGGVSLWGSSRHWF